MAFNMDGNLLINNIMKKNFVIKSGKIMLSDPCYDLGTIYQGVIDKVKNGVWIADTIEDGGRISRLIAHHIIN